MEYVYAAMLLNSLGKEITEDSLIYRYFECSIEYF